MSAGLCHTLDMLYTTGYPVLALAAMCRLGALHPREITCQRCTLQNLEAASPGTPCPACVCGGHGPVQHSLENTSTVSANMKNIQHCHRYVDKSCPLLSRADPQGLHFPSINSHVLFYLVPASCGL